MDDAEVERPETFEPFEKWKAAWKPEPEYVSLTEAAKRIVEAGKMLPDILPRCQCLGWTMHKVVELPTHIWASETWQFDVEQNSCGQPQYAEHLQFQVSIFEADLQAALEGRPTPYEVPPPAAGPPRPLEVEDADIPGLPEGWIMRTVEGAAWQAVRPESEPPVHAPMRAELSRAVADAWSYSVNQRWS